MPQQQQEEGNATKAVNTPSGSSAGLATVRATTSAPSTSAAPSSAEPGSTTRWSGPASSRTAWGATRPMKPMMPVVAVTTPTASTVASTAVRLTRSTFTPISTACASPSAMAFSGLASVNPMVVAIKIIADTSMTALQRAPPRLPRSQNWTLRNCSSVAMKLSSPSPAPASALIATPASSISPTRVPPSDWASAYTSAVTSSAPPNAMVTSVQLPSARGNSGNHQLPSTMLVAAASAAPPLTPTRPGSASGLRNRPCISAPAMPRPAPAARPSSSRGRRML